MHPDLQSLDHFTPRVRGLARSLLRQPRSEDVEDVVQEVFLVATRRHAQYRGGDPWPWLAQITAHIARNTRRRNRRGRQPLDGLDPADAARPEPVDTAHQHLLADRVRRALAGLPHEQCEALQLTYVNGMSRRDAAGHLGISFSMLNRRVQAGLDQLRERLGITEQAVVSGLTAGAGAGAVLLLPAATRSSRRSAAVRQGAITGGGVSIVAVATAAVALVLVGGLVLAGVQPRVAEVPVPARSVSGPVLTGAERDAAGASVAPEPPGPAADADVDAATPAGTGRRAVRLVVRDAETGEPVADAHLRLVARGSLISEQMVTARSNASGHAQLELPDEAGRGAGDLRAPLMVHVGADGYKLQRLAANALTDGSAIILAPLSR